MDVLKLKSPAFDIKNRAFEKVRLKGFEPQTFGSVDRCSKITNADKTNTYDSTKSDLIPSLIPNRAPEAQIDPVFDEDLQGIISAWDTLPDYIKKSINALVQSVSVE